MVAPAATVTLVDTCAAAVLLLARVTSKPPVGAGPLRETVPRAGAPPGTEAGLTATETTTGAFTVMLAVWVEPHVAEIVTPVFDATALLVAVKVAVVAPAATVTLVGTCAAAELLLASVTSEPPVGAGPLRETVPRPEAPP